MIQIKNIQGIVDVKVSRLFKRSIVEPTVKISDKISGYLMNNPIGEITRAEKNKDYFKVSSYTCAIFGCYGRQILLRSSILSKSKVDDMTLSSTIEELMKIR